MAWDDALGPYSGIEISKLKKHYIPYMGLCKICQD